MKKIFCFLCLVLVSNMVLAQEKPGLLVTPTRVVLEGKNRSATISLVNNGDIEGTYAISIVNKRMREDGSIVEIEQPIDGEKFAEDMLRISPRRVTLKPGERQNVRILARKADGVADGEYRSHLSFAVLPQEETPATTQENEDDSLTIKIKANFGVTIPVIVRSGQTSATGEIVDLRLKSDEQGRDAIAFTVNRSGNQSLYGDIKVVYTNTSDKEYVLKSLGGLAVYTPNAKRTFEITLDVPDGVQVKGGTLEVQYKEKSEEGGELIASKKLTL
jgi:P pilus assembly chaperone PapD